MSTEREAAVERIINENIRIDAASEEELKAFRMVGNKCFDAGSNRLVGATCPVCGMRSNEEYPAHPIYYCWECNEDFEVEESSTRYAGTQSRQQPEAVMAAKMEAFREIEAEAHRAMDGAATAKMELTVEGAYYGAFIKVFLMHEKLRGIAALASLPSEKAEAKEPTDAEVEELARFMYAHHYFSGNQSLVDEWWGQEVGTKEQWIRTARYVLRKHRHLGAGGGKEKV